MLWIVLALFAAAVLAPFAVGRGGDRAALVLAAVPALALVVLLVRGSAFEGGWSESTAWYPSLGVQAGFRLDGLSALMACLILGIGTLVFAYAGRYLAGDPNRPRFFAILFAFAGAMLGLVLADDAITLFVFWELTSITSFLLIGYEHEKASARDAARQGLLVTAGGGLAMLAGFIVLGQIAGSYRLSELPAQRETLVAHPQYGLALTLIAIGAFSKSAQFPFHFWLPNAMAAPTPVSAYLHSATMVKAGVYLLARLHPALGGTPYWFWLLAPVGALTMLTGAWLAYRHTQIKQVLAYSTLMALGTLTLLLGLGAPGAALVYLLAHAFYKGALFLIAGILDHEAGAKDLREVSGQYRALPLTALAAALAALSLAGLPPVLGFVAKELLLETTLHAPLAGLWTLAALAAACFTTAMAGVLAIRPFFGAVRAPQGDIHEAPAAMLAGPLLLALGGAVFGGVPALAEYALLQSAAQAAGGAAAALHLALWHGFNAPLALSAVALAIGAALFAFWPRLQPRLAAWAWIDRFGPETGFNRALGALPGLARAVTRRVQSGSLPRYIRTIVLVVLVLTGTTMLTHVGQPLAMPLALPPEILPLLVAALALGTAFAALRQQAALHAVLLLGASGYCVALLFVWYSAPDLAITQLLIETLTAILLVLVLFRLPRFRQLSSRGARVRDALIATAFGALITALLWMVLAGRSRDAIADWFVEHAYVAAHGRNVVNVIIVDFRALDTLGEIFVRGLAAVGVYAMLARGRMERRA